MLAPTEPMRRPQPPSGRSSQHGPRTRRVRSGRDGSGSHRRRRAGRRGCVSSDPVSPDHGGAQSRAPGAPRAHRSGVQRRRCHTSHGVRNRQHGTGDGAETGVGGRGADFQRPHATSRLGTRVSRASRSERESDRAMTGLFLPSRRVHGLGAAGRPGRRRGAPRLTVTDSGPGAVAASAGASADGEEVVPTVDVTAATQARGATERGGSASDAGGAGVRPAPTRSRYRHPARTPNRRFRRLLRLQYIRLAARKGAGASEHAPVADILAGGTMRAGTVPEMGGEGRRMLLLGDLPGDVTGHVLSYLGVGDLLRLTATSKFLHAVVSSSPLWRDEWHRRFRFRMPPAGPSASEADPTALPDLRYAFLRHLRRKTRAVEKAAKARRLRLSAPRHVTSPEQRARQALLSVMAGRVQRRLGDMSAAAASARGGGCSLGASAVAVGASVSVRGASRLAVKQGTCVGAAGSTSTSSGGRTGRTGSRSGSGGAAGATVAWGAMPLCDRVASSGGRGVIIGARSTSGHKRPAGTAGSTVPGAHASGSSCKETPSTKLNNGKHGPKGEASVPQFTFFSRRFTTLSATKSVSAAAAQAASSRYRLRVS